MEPITLFYATNNKSKLHNMRYRLWDYPIQVLCPDDLDIHIEINENGKNAVENAIKKARAYYNAVNMPTIAADSGVYIEGLPDNEQPGLFVRRVNGKILTDDEMIDYYSFLARKTESECYLCYLTGIALIINGKLSTMNLEDAPLQLSAYPNSNRLHRGNPLDVVTLTENGKYYNELSDEERIERDQLGEQTFTQFILNNLFRKV